MLFSELRWEVIVCFVDVGRIVGHHCLNSLVIKYSTQWKIMTRSTLQQCCSPSLYVRVSILLMCLKHLCDCIISLRFGSKKLVYLCFFLFKSLYQAMRVIGYVYVSLGHWFSWFFLQFYDWILELWRNRGES